MKRIFLFISILSFVSIAEAATIHVPGTFVQIQSAIKAAANGDTVLVAPGIYRENLNFLGKRIVVVSARGAAATTITPLDGSLPIIQIRQSEPKGTVLQGFTITGGGNVALQCSASSPSILDNRILRQGNISWYAAIEMDNTVGSVVRGNIIAFDTASNFNSNLSTMVQIGSGSSNCVEDTFCYNTFYADYADLAIWCFGASSPHIYNNTFVSGEANNILLSGSGACDIKNNILAYHGTRRAVAGFAGTSTCSYNALFVTYGLGDFSGVNVGPGNVDGDVLFLDGNNRDYRVLAGSPIIDAGDPSPVFNDADGTRNDIGAIPFTPAPYLSRINLGAERLDRVLTLTPTIFWTYLDPAAIQTAFEVEVSSDENWPTADMWQSGIVNSTNNSVVYGGAPLSAGASYFVRVRVNNGTNWSAWETQFFHTYGALATPIPLHPLPGEQLPATALTLTVQSSRDKFRDSVKYDFEIYRDQDLTMLFDSRYGVAQGAESTYVTGLAPIVYNSEYWWRVRSFDGITYSSWSVPMKFTTRQPVTIRVPLDYTTIQAALNIAGYGDTILVSPGTYIGPIIFPQRNMILRSTDGARNTIITGSVIADLITFTGGVDSTTLLEGFSFVGGRVAIWCQNSGPTIRRNIVRDLETNYYSAITLSGTDVNGEGVSPAVIVNNTIIRSRDAGVLTLSTVAPQIRNNIIAGSPLGIEALWSRSPIVVDHNDVHATYHNYERVIPDAASITVDPQLYEDFQLAPSSACIDAGNPDPAYNDPDGTRCDLGAIPLTSCCGAGQLHGDLNGDLAVNLGDLSILVAFLASGSPTLPCSSAANVSGKGAVDLSDLSVLVKYLTGQLGTPLTLCTSPGL